MKRSREGSDGYVSSNSEQQQRPKRMRSNNASDVIVRLKPPSQVSELAHASESSSKVCAFCCLSGSFRECEGQLLGPFKSPYRRGNGPNTIYAHRNCALWSPHTFEGKNGQLERVDIARKLMRKCIFCREKGASLHCTHKGRRCCRAMHFRCALLGGAILLDGFEAFCPLHANFRLSDESKLRLLELGPISDILLQPGNGCTYCGEDSYDRLHGVILTCTTCNSRAHSKCIFPKDRDAVFLTPSSRAKHFCENCMVCVKCESPVNNREYQQRRLHQKKTGYEPSDIDLDHEDRTVLVCHACNYFACHSSCVPQTQHKYWRCNRCRVCRHCSKAGVSDIDWWESEEACGKCYDEIQNGAVICPVCEKLYRDFEDLEMVQCDGCDKWIHAISCGHLSLAQFKRLQSVKSESYYCPSCEQTRKGHVGKKRSHRVSSRDNKASNRTRPGRCTPAISINDLPPLNDEVAFFNTRSAGMVEPFISSKVTDDLAIGTELCRLCCGSMSAESYAACLVCGECYHYRCDSLLTCKELNHTNVNGINHLDCSQWICSSCKSAAVSSPNVKTIVDSIQCAAPIESDIIVAGNGGVSWPDKRICELCGKRDDDKGIGTRLIPWRSSVNTDLSDIWIHIGCATVSAGMVLLLSNGGATFLSQRRVLLGMSRKSRCGSCGKAGATVKCHHAGCTQVFHADCAEDAGFTYAVSRGPLSGSKSRERGNRQLLLYGNNGEVCSVILSCSDHSRQSSARLSLSKTFEYLNLHESKIIRIIDSQGFVEGSEAGRTRLISMRRLASVRVGSLSVLKFGILVPESENFVVEGCLVPLGYCAARRYWSARNTGERCTYLLEVSGHIQTGPLFRIRSSEDNQLLIEKADVHVAWAAITQLISQVQPWVAGITKIIDGLDAFGLKNCTAVVQHIESLPLAAMFGRQYAVKYGVETKCSEVVFYESLAKKYTPSKIKANESGCARTEGYLPRRKRQNNSAFVPAPSYDNSRSGLAFQLKVVREVLCNQREVKNIEVIAEDKRIENRVEKSEGTVPSGRRRRCSVAGPARETSHETPNGILVVERKTSRVKKDDQVTVDKSGPVIIIDDDVKAPRSERSIAPDAKRRTRILRSEIDGWGVFATEDIPAEQLIVEYVGELIRPVLSDIREGRYQAMGIGCYMFQIVPGLIVDATLCGNASRFINHSCAPNCYSKTVHLSDGNSVVAIFSKRRIQRGEELSYDYQFPFDDEDRVICGCGAVQCRGYMN